MQLTASRANISAFSQISKVLYRGMIFVTLLSVVYLVALIFFGWRNEGVIYWLAWSGTESIHVIPYLIVGCASILLLTTILLRKPQHRTLRRNAAAIFGLSLFTAIIIFIAYLVGIWQWGLFGYREHLSTAYLSNNTYHLQLHMSDPGESYSTYYSLYECPLNLFCTELYTVSKSNGITPPVEQIELQVEAATNTLKLMINGEPVLTKHL